MARRIIFSIAAALVILGALGLWYVRKGLHVVTDGPVVTEVGPGKTVVVTNPLPDISAQLTEINNTLRAGQETAQKQFTQLSDRTSAQQKEIDQLKADATDLGQRVVRATDTLQTYEERMGALPSTDELKKAAALGADLGNEIDQIHREVQAMQGRFTELQTRVASISIPAAPQVIVDVSARADLQAANQRILALESRLSEAERGTQYADQGVLEIDRYKVGGFLGFGKHHPLNAETREELIKDRSRLGRLPEDVQRETWQQYRTRQLSENRDRN